MLESEDADGVHVVEVCIKQGMKPCSGWQCGREQPTQMSTLMIFGLSKSTHHVKAGGQSATGTSFGATVYTLCSACGSFGEVTTAPSGVFPLDTAILCTHAGSFVSASYTQLVRLCEHRLHFGRSPEHFTFDSRQGTQDRNVRLRLMPMMGSTAVPGRFTADAIWPFCTQSSCSRSQLRQPLVRSSHLTCGVQRCGV